MHHAILKATPSKTYATFALVFFASLFLLMPPLVGTAGAQATKAQYASLDDSRQQAKAKSTKEDDTQTAVRAATTPDGDRSRITESTDDPDEIVDLIVVPAADCEVDPDAVVVVEDDDGTRVTLTNNQNVVITATQDQVEIVGRDTGGNLTDLDQAGGDSQFGTVSSTVTGEIVRASGIACGSDKGEGGNPGGGTGGGTGGGSEAIDNLLALSCTELLQRFQNNTVGQYGDPFVNAEVQARIAECLVNVPEDPLPKTGGLPLLGLAVLGLASVVGGVSVIRGVGREE